MLPENDPKYSYLDTLAAYNLAKLESAQDALLLAIQAVGLLRPRAIPTQKNTVTSAMIEIKAAMDSLKQSTAMLLKLEENQKKFVGISKNPLKRG